MTMVASFMPSLAFAATGVNTSPVIDSIDADTNHVYHSVSNNASVQALLNDPDTKDYVVNFTPSTCDQDGSVTLKCKKSKQGEVCDVTKTFVIAKGHEYGTEKVRFSTIESYAKAMQAAKAPGFKNDAQVAGQIAKLSKTYCYVEAKVCKNCGRIDAEHSTIDDGVATAHIPTATSQGNDCRSTTECVTCHKELAKTSTRAKHSFESDIDVVDSNATPTAEKKLCGDVIAKTYTCTACGETKTTYTKNGVVTAPTCKIFKNPINVVTATDGKVYKKGTTVVVKDSEGVKAAYKYDSLFDAYYEADTSVVENDKTYYAFTCNECGHVTKGAQNTGVTTAAHKHAWKKVTEDATCTVAPKEAAYCEGCGMYSAVVNAGTANAVAESAMKDNFADASSAVSGKAPLGHKLVVKKVEATCVTPAHYEISCSVCADKYAGTKYVSFVANNAKPSKYLDPVTGALDDGASYGDIELTYLDPATKNHAFTKKVVLQDASCEVNALEGFKCDTCGKMDLHNVAPVAGTKLGHKVVKNEVAATCGTDGYYTEECSACGKVLNNAGTWVKKTADTVLKKTVTDKALVAVGAKHTGETWKVTKAATVFDEGVKTLVCDTCGVELGSKTPTAKSKYAAPAVKAGKKSATVTVKATAGAVSYKISYKKAGGSYKTIAAKAGKKTIKKLAKGKKYTFKAIAVNAEGVEVASATKTVKVK